VSSRENRLKTTKTGARTITSQGSKREKDHRRIRPDNQERSQPYPPDLRQREEADKKKGTGPAQPTDQQHRARDRSNGQKTRKAQKAKKVQSRKRRIPRQNQTLLEEENERPHECGAKRRERIRAPKKRTQLLNTSGEKGRASKLTAGIPRNQAESTPLVRRPHNQANALER